MGYASNRRKELSLNTTSYTAPNKTSSIKSYAERRKKELSEESSLNAGRTPNQPNLAMLNRVTDEDKQQINYLNSPEKKQTDWEALPWLQRRLTPRPLEAYETDINTAKTAMGNKLVSGLTLSLSDKLMDNMATEESKKKYEQAYKDHPIASTTGEVLGSIAPWSGAEKLIAKAGGKVINKVGSELGKRIIIGGGAGALTEGVQSAIEGNNAKKIATDAAVGGAMGGAGEVLGATIGKGVNKLISFLKKPAHELAKATETIPLEKIVRPVSSDGKYKLVNKDLKQAWDDYDNAIYEIQNKYQTNELRADELAQAEKEFGLNSIIDRIEKAQSKSLLSPKELASRRAYGVASNKTTELTKNIAKQSVIEIPQPNNPSMPLNIISENANINMPLKRNMSQLNKNTRGFAQTVVDSDVASPELKQLLKKDLPTYTPISNNETLNKAKSLVDSNIDAAKERFATPTNGINADDVALGESLIVDALKKGNVSEANRYTVDLAEKLTTAGQAVQAASIFKRMTPEGMLMYAQRVVNGINRNIEKDFGKLAKKVTLTDQEANEIVKRMTNAVKLPEGRQKAIEMARTMQIITNKMPATLIDKSRALRNISLLGNTKTFSRNVIGNALMGVTDNIANAVGVPLDIALSKVTKKRSVALPSLKVLGKGFATGGKEAISDAFGGLSREELRNSTNKLKTITDGFSNPIDTSAIQGNKFETGRKLSFKNKPLRIAENLVNTSLAIGDRPFSQAYYDDVLNQLKKANKVTDATPEMMQTAERVAKERTYQDANSISQAFEGLKNIPQYIKNPVVKRVVQIAMDSVIPYAKTPATILKRGLEMTPVGVIEGISKLSAGLLKKDISIDAQREIIDRIARGLVGSALLTSAYFAAKKGVLTGAANKDKDIAAFDKSLGKQPYSIKYGDNKYYPYDWAQPASMPFGAGAQAALSDNKKISNVALDSVSNALDFYADQPMMQSIQRLMNDNYGSSTWGDRLLAASMELPKQFIPTLLKQIEQYQDPNQRETYSPNTVEKNLTNQVKTRIPRVAGSLPVKSDVFGNDIKTNQGKIGTAKFFDIFFNPGNSTKYNPDATQKEIMRIYNATGEKVQFPRVADKSIEYQDPGTKQKAKTELSGEEYTQYQKLLGQLTMQKFKQLISRKEYGLFKDSKKADMLQNLITQANKEAKQHILKQKGLVK